MKDNDKKILRKSTEVAQMLNISAATLKKLVMRGEIQAITINNRRYFSDEAISDFIFKHTGTNAK